MRYALLFLLGLISSSHYLGHKFLSKKTTKKEHRNPTRTMLFLHNAPQSLRLTNLFGRLLRYSFHKIPSTKSQVLPHALRLLLERKIAFKSVQKEVFEGYCPI